MRNYRVTVEVDYVIKAVSLSEALQFVSESSEHPLVGGSELGYCDDVRVIGGANAQRDETRLVRARTARSCSDLGTGLDICELLVDGEWSVYRSSC